MNTLKDFFFNRIWEVKISRLPKKSAILLQICRILSLTGRFFVRNKCSLHASALTYYTLLSIVPVAALFFGIAKGYGFDEVLKTKIHESMPGQEQISSNIIRFAENALNNASGGVVAGFGVIMLFWTALKLLTNIEKSFNEIWGVRNSRPFIRKLSDYLTMLVLCPLLMILLATSSTLVVTLLQKLASHLPFTEASNHIILMFTKALPFFLAWFTFSFLYIFIPNTKVKFKAAFISGAIIGVIYVCVQFAYIYLQKILTGYNAIYGSFAALPFFLLWLQISWSLILLGAQISFSVQNVNIYELSPDDRPISGDDRALCALRIMTELARRFEDQQGPISVQEISEKLEIPIRLTRSILFDLCACGAAAKILTEEKAPEVYQTAIPVDSLTPVVLLRRLFALGSSVYKAPSSAYTQNVIDMLWQSAEKSDANRLLIHLKTPASK